MGREPADVTSTTRKASAVDRFDVFALVGASLVSAGIWEQFGSSWALMGAGALMLVGAFVFAFAAARTRVDPS
jgi:fucose permease